MTQNEFKEKYLTKLQQGKVKELPPITIESDLYLVDEKVVALPDNLTIKGDFICKGNHIKREPINLVVDGNLDTSYKYLKVFIRMKLRGQEYIGFSPFYVSEYVGKKG